MARKIMIIDDEPDISMYLSAVLEDNGYDTCLLGEKENVSDAVLDQKPDLIVLDIMMPRRSGVSIYKELRTGSRFRNIPIVLISGMPKAKDFMEEEMRNLVADDTIPLPDGLIEKPIKVPALIELIGKSLGEGTL